MSNSFSMMAGLAWGLHVITTIPVPYLDSSDVACLCFPRPSLRPPRPWTVESSTSACNRKSSSSLDPTRATRLAKHFGDSPPNKYLFMARVSMVFVTLGFAILVLAPGTR
jgi:hypothetical protein